MNECLAQKLSRFEYLKNLHTFCNCILFCFSMFLCNSLKKKCRLISSVLKGNEKEGDSCIGSQFREEIAWTWALDQRVT